MHRLPSHPIFLILVVHLCFLVTSKRNWQQVAAMFLLNLTQGSQRPSSFNTHCMPEILTRISVEQKLSQHASTTCNYAYVHAPPHLSIGKAGCPDLIFGKARHVFEVQDSLCRRFASALGQYQVLVCIVTAKMDKQISVVWHVVLSALSPNVAPPVPNPNLHTHSNTRSVLSDYLRSWCLLCFRGDVSGGGKLPDFFLCLDACFTIRRNKELQLAARPQKATGIQDPCIMGDRVKTPGERFSDTGVMAGWVCQLWYNPRKGGVWGLTDGEGCERLWNDLRASFQISVQVSGWRSCVKATKARLIIAQEKRARIPLSDEFLQSQFEEQRAYQSRPLERQSKKKGFLAVEKILAVRQRLDAARDLVEALQKQLIAIPVSDTIATRNEVGEITSALAEQEKVVSCLSKQEDDLTAILKLGDPVSYDNLKKMKDHPWFEHQLNMRALKACILAKACQRNFEAHNLTGAFRSKALGELFIVGV
ncbi:hypothetical protein BS47DRAFT_1368264 [Hydnum rufescens UP504]|uniref:Uncharacterized protein n=1 Tax=Hydnum rufescens UP504 TaxID=1448309 RepID=A0A9P6DP09_9AGAM|nr:hypothetical protein BS47DRAFT_1368264 [Hydnum rufescens UP504]